MENRMSRNLRKTRGRERFYSSMSYAEYYDYFGPPPTPIFKPQIDPEDIPELNLDQFTLDVPGQNAGAGLVSNNQLEVIPEIQASQNQTVNDLLSPRKRPHFEQSGNLLEPKRSHSRMRSQSQNSQYLIFNFLDRFTRKPSKKVKCQ